MTEITSSQNNNVECAICYDNFKSSPISLICGHKFDENCIVEWFNKGNHTCPCCRAIIPQPIIINKKHNKINPPRITINYKRMYIYSNNYIISIFIMICIELYNDIIQYKIHNKYVNNDDVLLIFLFITDIFFTILIANSLLLILYGMGNLDLQIDVNDYMSYIKNDKHAESIFKGFYFYFVSIIFLIGLRIPAYCKSWNYLNADNMKSSNDALYINMIISSVLHTVLFILMTYYFWISYKYIKINAKIRRTTAS